MLDYDASLTASKDLLARWKTTPAPTAAPMKDNGNVNIDVDKIPYDIAEYSKIADDCRVKARAVKKISFKLPLEIETGLRAAASTYNNYPLDKFFFFTCHSMRKHNSDIIENARGNVNIIDDEPQDDSTSAPGLSVFSFYLDNKTADDLKILAAAKCNCSLVEMLFSLSVSTYILNKRLIEDVRDKYPDNAEFFTDERQQKYRSKAKDKIGAALLPITVIGKWLKLPTTATSFQRALIMDTDEPPF